MRHTGRAVAKAGHSDPRAICGSRRAYRIKATLGITESSRLSVPSVGAVCYLDVGLTLMGLGHLKSNLQVNIWLITVDPSSLSSTFLRVVVIHSKL